MLKNDLDDLLYIPDFLRRADWTAEDHERSEQAFHTAQEEEKRQKLLAAKAMRDKAEKIRLEQESVLEARRDRKEQRQQATARSLAKKQQRAKILELIGSGRTKYPTHGKIVNATGIDGKVVSNHLRYLLNHGKIRKVSARRYAPV